MNNGYVKCKKIKCQVANVCSKHLNTSGNWNIILKNAITCLNKARVLLRFFPTGFNPKRQV